MNEKETETSTEFVPGWGLYVAGYAFWCQVNASSSIVLTPPKENDFYVEKRAEDGFSPAFSRHIDLEFHQEEWRENQQWGTLIHCNKIWELWQDDADKLVMLNPSQPVRRRVVINPGFTAGKVFGDFSRYQNGKDPVIPEELQIVLLVNWLANAGEIILHACGVKFHDKGYAFLGNSGAGKSTLASALNLVPDVKVLGEDQVVLRYIEGDFWIFGTPWHFNHGLCSPEGAKLAGLYFLERTGKEVIKTLAPFEGIKKIMQTAFIPYYRPETLDGILANLARLSEVVPFSLMSFTLKSDVRSLLMLD